MFDPAGLLGFVRNWDEVAETLIQRVHREAVGGFPDAETLALLRDLFGYPGVPSQWSSPDFRTAALPVVAVMFQKAGLALSYFSTVTTLGTPQDAMLQETPIESFFPADDATAAHTWKGPAGARSSSTGHV